MTILSLFYETSKGKAFKINLPKNHVNFIFILSPKLTVVGWSNYNEYIPNIFEAKLK